MREKGRGGKEGERDGIDKGKSKERQIVREKLNREQKRDRREIEER